MYLQKIITKLKVTPRKYLLRRIDQKFGFAAIERMIFSHWFNPIATLWLNLRSFPLHQAIKMPIFVFGHPRLYCLAGEMRIEGQVRPGMITFNRVAVGGPSCKALQSEINNMGLIIFLGRGTIGCGCRIEVKMHGILKIGDNFKLSDFSNVGVLNKIVIGNNTRIAHRCQLFDSNYHYIANFEKRRIPNHTRPIHIGNGCWICNTTTITGGTRLPDFTIVGSMSLVNRDFTSASNKIPEGSIIGGIPAKHVVSGVRRIENMEIEKKVSKFYEQHPDSIFELYEDANPEVFSQIIEWKEVSPE